jgi:hypothetical protein
MKNEALEMVLAELHQAGLGYSVDPTRTHIHVKFKVGTVEKTQVLPKTASDWRAAKNARALLRRTLKDLGVTLAAPVEKPAKPAAPPPAPAAAPRQHPLLLDGLLGKVQELEAVIQRLQRDIVSLSKPAAPPPAPVVEKTPKAFMRASVVRAIRRASRQKNDPRMSRGSVIGRASKPTEGRARGHKPGG